MVVGTIARFQEKKLSAYLVIFVALQDWVIVTVTHGSE